MRKELETRLKLTYNIDILKPRYFKYALQDGLITEEQYNNYFDFAEKELKTNKNS